MPVILSRKKALLLLRKSLLISSAGGNSNIFVIIIFIYLRPSQAPSMFLRSWHFICCFVCTKQAGRRIPNMKDRKRPLAAPTDVLIVDADESSQKSLNRAIRRAGFKTTVARNDLEAQYRTAKKCFPLIVIDLWQANRAAVNLVQHLRHECPSSKIIVITPYEAELFQNELEGLDVFVCLRKPVKRDLLLEVVQRALSAAPTAIA